MAEIFDRTKLLIGEENFKKLADSNILIVGVGGVGGFALEVLTRSGIGNFTIVDGDNVDITNINRQIIALNSTIGQSKVHLFEKRMKDINPNVNVRSLSVRFNEETLNLIFDRKYDYIVDCIDSVPDKLLLIKTAKEKNINIVSAMGAGNRIKISDFKIMDIFKTTNDKLAKKMRKLLKDNGIFKLDVVCCEAPAEQIEGTAIGSISYMPPLAGIKLGGFVVEKLINNNI